MIKSHMFIIQQPQMLLTHKSNNAHLYEHELHGNP